MAGGLYDRIGANYSATRRADHRLAAAIWEAIGDAATVVNVGPIPHDCMDGFYGAFWRRPEAFLDP